MLLNLLAGFAGMLLCLAMQSLFVSHCLRRYACFKGNRPGPETGMEAIALLSMVMLLMQLGNFVRSRSGAPCSERSASSTT
jgi:hypothetical protein